MTLRGRQLRGFRLRAEGVVPFHPNGTGEIRPVGMSIRRKERGGTETMR